jgi:hypothetical protein
MNFRLLEAGPRRVAMPMFRVKIANEHGIPSKEFLGIEATTPKEAAERVIQAPLSETGSLDQLRAEVRRDRYMEEWPISFFEAAQRPGHQRH